MARVKSIQKPKQIQQSKAFQLLSKLLIEFELALCLGSELNEQERQLLQEQFYSIIGGVEPATE